MPDDYLTIVYAQISGTGKFSGEEFFLSTEKKISARTFSPKKISDGGPRDQNHRKKFFPVEILASKNPPISAAGSVVY
jgi:hypothetical protein